MWVNVGKELPCQREWANSKDPFTVAVTTGELIVGCKKISTVCSMFLQQNGSIFYWVTGSAAQWQCAQLPQLVSKKLLEEEIFTRRNFHKLVFSGENRDNFCLTKISHYMVSAMVEKSFSVIVCRLTVCTSPVIVCKYINSSPVSCCYALYKLRTFSWLKQAWMSPTLAGLHYVYVCAFLCLLAATYRAASYPGHSLRENGLVIYPGSNCWLLLALSWQYILNISRNCCKISIAS